MNVGKDSVPLFASVLTDLNVSFSTERGRFLAAKSEIKHGPDVVLFSEEPLAVSMHSTLSGVCHQCMNSTPNGTLVRCSRCKIAFYCSQACQRQAFKAGHREECAAIAKLDDGKRLHFDERCLLAVRLVLWIIKNTEMPVRKRLLTLQTHADKRAESTMAQFNFKAAIVGDVLKFLEAPDCKYVSVAFVTTVLTMLCSNSLGIVEEEELTTVGEGMYVDLSLLNHSCQPNCMVVFRGATALLRPLRNIAANEELTISYIDVAQSREARRSELRQNYFFECCCALCASSRADDLFDVCFRCEHCKGIVLENESNKAVCNSCGQESLVPPFDQSFPDEAAVITTKRLKSDFDQLESVLHPKSLHLRSVLQICERLTLQQTLQGNSSFVDVLYFSRKLVHCELERTAGRGDALLFRYLYGAGRIALEAHRYIEALQWLRQCADAGYGTPNSLFRHNLYKMVMEAEQLARE